MSDPGNQDYEAAAGSEPGRPEPARLRRRPFGYRRADVDRALDARDSDIAELRQDIAALWLAFAQHDRMIRGATSAERVAGSSLAQPPERESAPPPARESVLGTETAATLEPELQISPDAAAAIGGADAIGRQLSDLDEVLAAIEMATQTLERTYADEIAAESEGSPLEDDLGRATAPGDDSQSADGVADVEAGKPRGES